MNNKNRPVSIYEIKWMDAGFHVVDRDKPFRTENATFQEWNNEDGEPCAIVELSDGQVITTPAYTIKFMDRG